jgi:S-methylmethionine-dependent homocysteine/selenocysteine methylase
MPSRSIVERLKAGEVLVMDGGTGSELQKRGVNVNKGATTEIRRDRRDTGSHVGTEGVWSASANLDAPDVVRKVHTDYLNAGAEIVISNNFYTSRSMMARIGEQDRWEEYTRRGGELAIEARDAVNPEAYVAGGFAPTMSMSGNLRQEFEDQSRVLAESGVDFLLPEYVGGDTVHENPIADCVTAADACATRGLPVFLGICNVKQEGTMWHGEPFNDLVEALQGHRVDGIFLMCSAPEAISACLPKLRKVFDGPIGAYGHLGYSENPKFGTSSDEPYFKIDNLEHNTPQRYAEFARQWKEMGAQVIGGCCATGPEHIEAVRSALKG